MEIHGCTYQQEGHIHHIHLHRGILSLRPDTVYCYTTGSATRHRRHTGHRVLAVALVDLPSDVNKLFDGRYRYATLVLAVT